MANKQPFYHRVTILFTDTKGMMRKDEIITAIGKLKGIVKGSVEIEEYPEIEPGDSADLM